MIDYGGRYRYSEADRVSNCWPSRKALNRNTCGSIAGSSAPLHQAVLAFTGPKRPFVMADPGYEAGASRRHIHRRRDHPRPADEGQWLRPRCEGDGRGQPDAGLIYICNPNNPTGTLTPQADIEWLVANKPAGSIVMIDEAYTHIAGAPFHTDLVAADKDVVILRTFSKIYGMAGLRAGAAIARPDLLEKLGGFSARHDADHGHGRRQRESGGEVRSSPSGARRSATSARTLSVPGQAQLQLRAVGCPTASWST